MSSLETRYAGTASGINNATSRVAGVLAIAILGSISLFSLSNNINERLIDLNLSAEVRAEVMHESSRLGNAQVPDSVPDELVEKVDRNLKLAFIDAFRLVMILCAVLAWLSALMAALLVEKKLVHRE